MSNSITLPDKNPALNDQQTTCHEPALPKSAAPEDQGPMPSDYERNKQPGPPHPQLIRWPKTIKPIQPRNSKQLAEDLGISLRVLRQYYQAIKDKVGERIGHMFSRKQVFIFYDHYGFPDGYFEN
ncbi:hypothetical protein WBG78_21665 [Chryseolinea sp. T2]|uniref:hypothetical protein n=1 Tax=Chryseolinea sp. T2 TaxID=3129255 RepID=UPI00307873A6